MTMKNKAWLIDDTGIILIGLLSLGYSIFSRWFAELNLKLPFLDFPIFIGEIALFICLCLLISKWIITHQKFNPKYYILAGYVVFVLAKALYGYFKYGSLAFRHAALFYYPLFAVCTYFFYRRGFFTLKKVIISLFLFLAIFLTNNFYEYYAFTFLILAFILINAIPNKKINFILTLLILFITPGKLFSHSYRTILTSNIVSTIFIICTIPFILNIKKIHKALILISLISGSIFGVIKLSDSNALRSLIDFQKNIALYREYTDIIKEKQDAFIMKEGGKVEIYNKEIPLHLSFLKKSEVPETEEDNINPPAAIESHKQSQAELQPKIKLAIREPMKRPLKIRVTPQVTKQKEQVPAQISTPEPEYKASATMPITEQVEPAEAEKELIVKKEEPIIEEESIVKEEPLEVAEESVIEEELIVKEEVPVAEEESLVKQKEIKVLAQLTPATKQIIPEKAPVSRDFETTMNKSIFRIPIWKDLWIIGTVEEKQLPSNKIQEEPIEISRELVIAEETPVVKEESGIGLQQESVEKQAKPKRSPRPFRNFETAVNNSIFRILIWKDLWRDINNQRPLLGFNFGKPFRSRNIEILNIAHWEWKRDGWICAHNSYLEIIYRAGIVGFLFLFALFTTLFMLINQAIHLKSLRGILLCSVLINWMVAAVFMVILELPYNAICFWALFGMTFAHLFNKKSSITN